MIFWDEDARTATLQARNLWTGWHFICRKHRSQGVYKRAKAWSKKGLRKSRLQDIRVSTPRVVRTSMRKDLIRAQLLLLCECLRKRKIESKLHKRRILERWRKGDLENKIKEQLALTSCTAIPWRIATSLEQWFTKFIHSSSIMKLSENSPGISIAMIIIGRKKKGKRIND